MKFRFPFFGNRETKISPEQQQGPEYNSAGQVLNNPSSENIEKPQAQEPQPVLPERKIKSKKERRQEKWKKKAEKQNEPKLSESAQEPVVDAQNISEKLEPEGTSVIDEKTTETTPQPKEPELTPEQKEAKAETTAAVIAEEAVRALVTRENLSLEQKNQIGTSQSREEIKQAIKKKKFLGDRAVDLVVGFGSGFAGTLVIKTLAGYGVRSALKRMGDFAAPGMGAITGAVVGGGYEAIKTTIQEKRRVKEEKGQSVEALVGMLREEHKKQLEGLTGEARFKKLVAIRIQEGENAFGNNISEVQMWEKYKNSKVNKKLIATNALKGTFIGGLGGAAGGWAAEKLFGAISLVHAADSHAASLTSKAAEGKVYAGVDAAAAKKDIVIKATSSTWDAVKQYLIEHKVNNVNNALINEATRKITDLNNIEITGDHLSKAAEAVHHHMADGVKDVLMHRGDEIHHLESLNELILQNGGTLEATGAAIHNLPPEGLAPAASPHLEMKGIDDIGYEEFKKLNYILGGLAGSVGILKILEKRRNAKNFKPRVVDISYQKSGPKQLQEAGGENRENIYDYERDLGEARELIARAGQALVERNLLEVINLHLRAGTKINTISEAGLNAGEKAKLIRAKEELRQEIKEQERARQALSKISPQPVQNRSEQNPAVPMVEKQPIVETVEADVNAELDMKFEDWKESVIEAEEAFKSGDRQACGDALEREEELYLDLGKTMREFDQAAETKSASKDWGDIHLTERSEYIFRVRKIREQMRGTGQSVQTVEANPGNQKKSKREKRQNRESVLESQPVEQSEIDDDDLEPLPKAENGSAKIVENDKTQTIFQEMVKVEQSFAKIDAEINRGNLFAADRIIRAAKKLWKEINIQELGSRGEKTEIGSRKHAAYTELKKREEIILQQRDKDVKGKNTEQAKKAEAKKEPAKLAKEKASENAAVFKNLNKVKYNLILKDKGEGGPLWAVVEADQLPEKKALSIQRAVKSVKDWSDGKVQLTPFVKIFSDLGSLEQTSQVKRLIAELSKLSPAMKAARTQAEQFTKKREQKVA